MIKEENGIVIGSEGGLYIVYTDEGKRIACKPRGKFRHDRMRLLVGDRVTLTSDEMNNRCVDEIRERKNALIRPPLANLDLLYIVVASRSPAPLYLNIDKLTAISEENGIETRIIISKSELFPEMAKELTETYVSAGYPVLTTGFDRPESVTDILNDIRVASKDRICAFVGASGVGKSTLINNLFPALRQETGAVNEKIGRGKHTTRAVTLFPFRELLSEGSGFLADTPGFTMLDFESFDFFDVEALPYNFPEISCRLGKCRYTKCTHRREEGCKIVEAVKSGEIAESRHQSYCLLYEQLKNKRSYKK